jgi:large repetitive protein
MTKMQRRKSFKQTAKRFFRSLLQSVLPDAANRKVRPIHFEPLESRQLMAADFYDAASMSAASSLPSSNTPAQFNSSSMSTAGLVGEGEDAPNLVEFARALTQAGVRFFGADWCPFCTEQKALFQDGAQFLPFIEISNPDRTRNATGISENITTYPTWEFGNGNRVTGVQTLQQLSTLSGVAIPTGSNPTFTVIPNQTVLNGSPLHVPVDAYDPNGGPLTITVSSSNPSVIAAEMVTNNKSWKLTVNGYGEMVYRLFPDEAARPVGRIESLTNSGFYNQTASSKIIFHRVIDNFVLQAGDPTGTGSGGSTLGNFDDQFDVDLQHNRTGMLSYAKSSDDTNDSQFFITEGPQRHLDFNHSIFGQIIEGDAVREGISRTKVTSDRPDTEISIKSAEIFNDTENGLIRLKALASTGTSTITVTVTDSTGLTFSRTFTATAAADTANGAPFLNDIVVPAIAPGQTVNIQLSSQDAEAQSVVYEATRRGSVDYQFNVNASTGVLSVTAPTNFTGAFEITAGVRATDQTSVTTGDKFDTQVLRFNVSAATTTPTSVDLASASDSGTSDSDNVTNAATMQFVVNGTTVGATVNLKVGSQIVGTAVATGTTTTITTTLVSQLGDGSRAIVASQTISGSTSGDSPSLTVTYDSTAPVAIPSTGLPSAANVGTALNFDLAAASEGQGLRYTLENAPAGLSVNQTTGVLTWTPISSQAGPQTANLRLTDTAGNSQTQSLSILVADTAKVGISLQLFDSTNNTPVTSASVGTELVLRIVLNDLRTGGIAEGDGVFSAYMDIVYDSDKLELVGTTPLTYASLFGNGRSVPVITTPGLIDELGAFSSFSVGQGRDPQLLAIVRLRVKATGQALISTNPAENASKGITIFKEDAIVPSSRVTFGSVTLPIGQNFVAVNDSFNFNEDSSNNSLPVLDNDTIVAGSGAVLTLQSVSTPSRGGTVSIASDNRRVIYTPAANINGSETFTYTVRDQTGASAVATVTVGLTAVNDNPVAVNDSLSTVKTTDVDVFIPVLTNDTLGPDTGETLIVTQVGTPSQGGTVRVATAGSGVVYTPRAGFTGNETFTYTISDGNGGTSTATVTATVSPAVPPPTVVGESFTISEDAAAADFNVLSNDTPPVSTDTLTITDAKSTDGTATITNNGTRLSFAPRANLAGQATVVYTVRSTNGGLANGTATFTVTAVNDAPDAVNDALAVLSSPNQSLNVLANDLTVDLGETLRVTAVTQPPTGQGTVSIGTDGRTILYTAPNTDFSGTVTFSYTLGDGSVLTDTASVTLTVSNFTPREVGIAIPLELQGLPLSVEVVPPNGSGATTVTTPLVFSSQGAKLSNVGPGEYRFRLADLPFLSGGDQTVVVNSAANDTSSLTTAFRVGTREARFIDIRDFMGQNLRRGLTAAVTPSTESVWNNGQGDWRNFSNIKVSLNSSGDQLTVRATNPSSQNVQATLPVSDSRVVMRGKEGNSSLFRIQANPSELTFAPATTTASTTTGSGEGESASTLNPALVDQAIQQVRGSMANLDDVESLTNKNTTANSNPISNGYRRGFRTR